MIEWNNRVALRVHSKQRRRKYFTQFFFFYNMKKKLCFSYPDNCVSLHVCVIDFCSSRDMKIAEHRAWTFLSLFICIKMVIKFMSFGVHIVIKRRNWMKIYFLFMETNLAQMKLSVSPFFPCHHRCEHENVLSSSQFISAWLIRKKRTKMKFDVRDIDKKTFIISPTDALPAETDARYCSEEERHVWRYPEIADVELGRGESKGFFLPAIRRHLIDGFH